MSDAPDDYRSFFARNQTKLEQRANHAKAWFAGLGALLAVLLVWLGSEFWVGVYVVVVLWMGLSGALGFRRLRAAVDVTEEAVGHLEEIAGVVEDDPPRKQLERYLEDMRTPEDRSNVPEALRHFVEGERVGDEPENVARSAFSHARDALEHAALLRNVLILGGLFGTVFFFALEIDILSQQMTNAEIGQLLRGLKGALACTLAGIASSVSVGFYGSDVDEQLDALVRETEAFLGGPVARAARRRPERRPVENETELWESLRAEVRQMTVETREAYEGVAEDIRAHTDALRDLGDRLADAPPIKVPEELRNLESSVEEFSGSARLLGELVPPLLETVAAMEVFAPAELVQGMEVLRQRLDELEGEFSDELARTQDEVRGAARTTQSAAESMEDVPEQMDRGFAALEDDARSLSGQVEDVRNAVEKEREARRNAYEQLADEVERTAGEIEDLRERTLSLPEEIRGAAGRLESAADDLEPLAGRLQDAGRSLEHRSSGDGSGPPAASSQVPELVDEVRQLRRRVAQIGGWIDRARSAPLMKLLTWPGFSRDV